MLTVIMMVVVAVVSFLIDVSPELTMKDKRIYEKHKKEALQMEESLSLELRTYQLRVTIALIFFVLNFIYLLFVLFIHSPQDEGQVF